MRIDSLKALALTAILTGCASVQTTESGRLTSYEGLKPSNGVLTKTKVKIDQQPLLAARSALLLPTAVADSAVASGLSPTQLNLVSNAIDRALCRDLSRRFVMVESAQPADFTVQVVITHITKTDKTAAGASVATSIGATVASTVTQIPMPSLRIPLGLGSLSVEAEARSSDNRQIAAFVWARAADAITTKPRVAEEGDAYTLATLFAADLAKLLVTASDPIADPTPLFPTGQTIAEYFGSGSKYAACKKFGKHPGVGDTFGTSVGLPPEWTDKGPLSQ